MHNAGNWIFLFVIDLNTYQLLTLEKNVGVFKKIHISFLNKKSKYSINIT